MIGFVELNGSHNRENFACGVDKLKSFLKNIARQTQKNGISRTLVVVDDKVPEEILEFCMLSLFELSSERLPKKISNEYRGKIPAVKIARLTTAKRQQNLGLGRHMLVNAFR